MSRHTAASSKGNTMFKRLSAVAVALSLALPVQAQDADTVVATVNGVEITIGHMIVARASLPQQYQQLPDDVLFQGILDQLVQQTALAQSFDGDLPARVSKSLENERRSLTAAEAIEKIMFEAVTPTSMQAAYESTYANQGPGEEFNASHILVETEDEAKALVTELEGGADFAELAKEKSTGPSGPGGGSLGWFGPGTMVAPFEQAVLTLETGQVSAPVETQFGWHVIKLNEKRNLEVPTMDEVRGELEQKVREEAVQGVVEELVAAADVDRSQSEEINPQILRDLSIVE